MTEVQGPTPPSTIDLDRAASRMPWVPVRNGPDRVPGYMRPETPEYRATREAWNRRDTLRGTDSDRAVARRDTQWDRTRREARQR